MRCNLLAIFLFTAAFPAANSASDFRSAPPRSPSVPASACTAGKDAASAPPLSFRDTGKNKMEDFAGEWIAYKLSSGFPSARLEGKIILESGGDWYFQSGDGKKQRMGVFHAADDFLLLKPDPVSGLKTAGGAASASSAVPGKLAGRDAFFLTGQDGVSILYRRGSKIAPATLEKLKGKWRFYDAGNDGSSRRASPFTLEFNASGAYRVNLKDPAFHIPPGAEKGLVSISADCVMLKNSCRTGDAWRNMTFFLLFDNLILNRPSGGYVYGEKL